MARVIKLYLPRSAGQSAMKAEPVHATGTPRGHETILVVEDDALVRGYVIAQLGGLGYRTLVASDGVGGTCAGRPGPRIRSAVHRHDHAGRNERPRTGGGRSRAPSGVKVLYTSGYTDDAIVHEGHLDPGVALLRKPYRKSDLAQKIREVLGSAIHPWNKDATGWFPPRLGNGASK